MIGTLEVTALVDAAFREGGKTVRALIFKGMPGLVVVRPDNEEFSEEFDLRRSLRVQVVEEGHGVPREGGEGGREGRREGEVSFMCLIIMLLHIKGAR